MKIFQMLIVFSYLETLQSLYMTKMNTFYQIFKTILEVNNEYTDNKGIFIGIWSQYTPQSIIQQVGHVGLMDSDCFLYLTLIGQTSTNLQLISYDCLYPETKTISKFLSFNANEKQQNLIKLDIDPFEYENCWYYFSLIYRPSISKMEYLIVKGDQLLLYEKMNADIFNKENLIMTIGGGLIVQNSNIESIENGSKFSYFPGSIYQVANGKNLTSLIPYGQGQDYQIYFKQSSIRVNFKCNCLKNSQPKLQDQDIIFLDKKTFISENINCDSFILSGWYKINAIHQVDDKFTYQFLKLMANFETEQLSNSNLAPFQLFYKISPYSNKLIITTYSYKFPSITLDFTNNLNTFIINQEFELNHKITLWHSLFVNLVQDKINIQIKYFDSYDVYEYSVSFNVKQFHNVQYKLLYGNLMKFFNNYLDIQTRNQLFFNCQQKIEQQNCHYTCLECDGPTQTDCLQCSEISKRIYLPQYKTCICPYDYLDDQINQNCISHTNLKLIVTSLPNFNLCQFGYFESDETCHKCPSIISDKLITCLECIKNVKGWSQNPYCQTTIYINPNGNTAQTILEEEQLQYIYDGQISQICRYCNKYPISNIDSTFYIYELILLKFKAFCQLNRWILDDEFDEINEEIDQRLCYECKFPNCLVCSIEITEIKCIQCTSTFNLQNGICTRNKNNLSLTYCLSPYYFNSIGECKLCPIKYCQYCFEYNKIDLSKCTLYADFEQFPFDENLGIGCALCNQDFIFDFNIGECLYQQPTLPNCLRSYVNLQNQEICTLSYTDFSVALEINNCERFIQNCLQCIFNNLSIVKCIICKSGFTSSIRFGYCYPNTLVDAKIVIEGVDAFRDGWIQRIQSFMMKFLPNYYFYSRFYTSSYQKEFQIECNEGYSLDPSINCIKFCDSKCMDCQYSTYIKRFYCAQCPLNSHYQPILSEEFGQCTGCPKLCQICQERSETEIYKLNSKFKINEKNRIYTKKCIKTISNSNVILDPYFQMAKYCYNSNCNSEYTYKFNQIYEYYQQNPIDSNQCYQLEINSLTFQFDLNVYYPDPNKVNYFEFLSDLKTEVFVLQFFKILIYLYQRKYDYALFSGFDCIEINDAQFKFTDKRYFQIANDNQIVNLILNNFTIEYSEIQDIHSLFDSKLFGDITWNNIQLINSNFDNSSLLNLKNNLSQGTIKIEKMILQNCSLRNSQLFSFSNNQFNIQIEQLIINSSSFFNSSIINFFTNFVEESKLKIHGLTVTQSQFHYSYILNCTDQLEISITNLIFVYNLIKLSTILGFNSNFTLLQTQINNNTFIESYFVASFQTETKKKLYCLIENYSAYQNEFKTSILFYIESSISNKNFYYQLRSIQLQYNQGQTKQQQKDISLFTIRCFQVKIENIQIINSNNLRIFYLFDVSQIQVKNILFENNKIHNKIPLFVNCSDYQNFNNQLFFISGYTIITLQNIKVLQFFSIDLSLIEISSNRKSATTVS
ncbi:unnamed protein product [Paramecium pentaurelia]|uniref:Uncharacterized protein n=1 Tax=Paramecium pentaurelia TaxID=43138 RepID=A0A8S1SXX5_9CILI|nr:unnamed protein product [Paramecium pentaurelia]